MQPELVIDMRIILSILLIPVSLVIIITNVIKSLFVKRTLYDDLMDIPGAKEQKELFDVMSAMNAGGCITNEMPNGIGEFGLVPTNPIPTNTVQGSILYLGGLRAPDGTSVNSKRLGRAGANNIEKPIDEYLITHENGSELATIYISPYQAANSKKAPKGLKQVSPLL
jgi:hypothetical protein